jgi:hypothetical protein
MLTEELTSVDARIEQLTRTRTHLTKLLGDVTAIMEEKVGRKIVTECQRAAAAREAATRAG